MDKTMDKLNLFTSVPRREKGDSFRVKETKGTYPYSEKKTDTGVSLTKREVYILKDVSRYLCSQR